MEDCDVDVENLSELSIAELSELNLDGLPLHALFAIEEHATGINHDDLLFRVQKQLQLRTLPKAAKIAAGQIIVAALHHHVIIGARGECQEPYAWDFKLDHPLWTREMELLPFAFSDDDDNEMYDDVCVTDSPTIMFYDALDQLLCKPDMVRRFKAAGGGAIPEFTFSACKAIIGVLHACEGKLLDDISRHLEQERTISAMDVCKLVDGIVVID